MTTDHCAICGSLITRSATGRPRKTCSARCRQQLHRQRRHPRLSPETRRFRAHTRRVVRRLTRKFGPPRDPDEYRRIALRLDREWPVLTCVECGRPFIHDARSGVQPKYCSPRCRGRVADRRYTSRQSGLRTEPIPYTGQMAARLDLRLRRGWATFKCEECDRPFIHDAPGTRPRYCSKRCRQAAYRHRRRYPLYRTCRQCRARYRVSPNNHHRQRYCSPRCRARARRAASTR